MLYTDLNGRADSPCKQAASRHQQAFKKLQVEPMLNIYKVELNGIVKTSTELAKSSANTL